MRWIQFNVIFLLNLWSCKAPCIVRFNEATCNDIKTLPIQLVDGVRNLTITSSYLPRIEAYSFGSSPRIQMLQLTGNDISFIEDNAFTGLIDIEMLYLDQNKIHFIADAAFENAVIKGVNLSYNELKEFPKALTKAQELKVVDLRYNNISGINYELTPLKDLEVLLLQNNSIKMIDPDVFSGLRKLRDANFTRNPYHCDCHLPRFDNWLTSYHFSRKSTELLGEYRCVSPPEFKGKPFDAFNLFGACSTPEMPKSAANFAEINSVLIGTCVLLIFNFRTS